jgi:hypothetical protein
MPSKFPPNPDIMRLEAPLQKYTYTMFLLIPKEYVHYICRGISLPTHTHTYKHTLSPCKELPL